MGEIDKQRVSAVRTLEEIGYVWDGIRWQPQREAAYWPEADTLHALLMDRAEVLSGCIEGTEQEDELRALADALEAYEARRWPEGKVPGGKG
ncbi:MAG TPA: hypothetical protein VF226_01195 [Hyphomicrobiaceae bacterium]